MRAIAPEPYASTIDVTTAAQHLERAIHAPTPWATRFWILRATGQLLHAEAYQQHVGNARMVRRIGQAVDALHAMAATAGAVAPGSLVGWQNGPLYNFQGVLGALAAALEGG